MVNEITKAVKAGNGTAVVYAAMAGLFLSDIIPTPADAVYFWAERRLKQKLNNNEITPKQYWVRDAVGYYLYNPLWWLLVIGVVVSVKGDYTKKIKIGIGLIGAGAVVAILYKNIKKDEAAKLADSNPQIPAAAGLVKTNA